MKANEIKNGKVLMIGDLVIGCIETDIVDEATYKILCKVTDINHYGDVSCEALKPFPDELDWQEGDDFSWIEAIPLTAEILEKNGFVDERSNYAYRTDNYHVCYYCADERLSINKYGAILDVHCFYVHDLQHALILCRIEKTIEL